MKKEINTTSVGLKEGDWAETLKGTGGVKKGTLVVIGVKDSYTDEKDTEIVYLDHEGISHNCDIKTTVLQKIVPPVYTVAWSTAYSDPFCYFKTLTDAQAFVVKLNKQKRDDRVIEIGIYKRVK